jgi:hypothetical protein
MQEFMMHLVSFVHDGTSMNLYNRSHTLIPFVEPSQRFLMHIKFGSPSAISHQEAFFTKRIPLPKRWGFSVNMGEITWDQKILFLQAMNPRRILACRQRVNEKALCSLMLAVRILTL